MIQKTFRFKMNEQNSKAPPFLLHVKISGEEAKESLSELYGKLTETENFNQCADIGLSVIKLFLKLFGEDNTEKLLLFCEKNPQKAMRKMKRFIRCVLFPLSVKQQKYENKQAVNASLSCNLLNFPRSPVITFKNKQYRVNTQFRDVFKSMQIIKNTGISEKTRLNIALKLLIKNVKFGFKFTLNHSEKITLLNKAFDVFHSSESNVNALPENANAKKILSLEKDIALIYSAFLQSFHIDLYKNELDWREFIALLSCIPENTVLFHVIKARKENGHENTYDYKNGLEQLFSKLEKEESTNG